MRFPNQYQYSGPVAPNIQTTSQGVDWNRDRTYFDGATLGGENYEDYLNQLRYLSPGTLPTSVGVPPIASGGSFLNANQTYPVGGIGGGASDGITGGRELGIFGKYTPYINALGAGAQLWLGYQDYKLKKKALAHQTAVDQANYNSGMASYNEQLGARRKAIESGMGRQATANAAVDTYLGKHGLKPVNFG